MGIHLELMTIVTQVGIKDGDPLGITACLGRIEITWACSFGGLVPSEGTLFSIVNA